MLRVVALVAVASACVMCETGECSDMLNPEYPAPSTPPDDTPEGKDIPINRPPKGEDIKRLRPRYGIGLQPSIVRPSVYSAPCAMMSADSDVEQAYFEDVLE